MALAMPSRFAVLKIEDDDFKPPNPNKMKDKKKQDSKDNSSKKTQLVNTAPKKSTKKKDKKKKETTEQWEQWKAKDNELVDGNYEQDLHDAILLSKLDYEEKKGMYKISKKETDQEKKDEQEKKAVTENLKKKKSKAMTLDQFNSLVHNGQESHQAKGDGSHESLSSTNKLECDDQFFDRIKSDTKEELDKEQRNKIKNEVKKPRKSFNDETITISQYQEKLEAQKAENALLRAELEKSRQEILAVKTRNKTLCGILAHGEMKDKADVLLELDRLSRVRDELTDEVTRLYGLLEQERSKVGALTAEPHPHNNHSSHGNHSNHGKKEKNKKRTSSENIQQ